MEGMVRVPLTLEGRASKADEMARLVKLIEGVKSEAKEKAAKFREEIDSLLDELSKLATEVRDGAEERNQMDLTFTQAEAARALAGVGTAACTCAGGPEAEVKDAACPTHGVAEHVPTTPPAEKRGRRKKSRRQEVPAS